MNWRYRALEVATIHLCNFSEGGEH
jgi:hypothetical protein